MANTLECKNCCYCWKDEDDRWPCCHWEARCPDDYPPCEEEDYTEQYWDEPITDYEEE